MQDYPDSNQVYSVTELRRRLTADAEKAKAGESEDCHSEWVDQMLWSQYTGKGSEPLYESFTDDELLNILRDAAAELGRLPSQKEIFCVYRAYIRRRFKNWPTALRAAGLKTSKPKARTTL